MLVGTKEETIFKKLKNKHIQIQNIIVAFYELHLYITLEIMKFQTAYEKALLEKTPRGLILQLNIKNR